jgi:hypothetical protein
MRILLVVFLVSGTLLLQGMAMPALAWRWPWKKPPARPNAAAVAVPPDKDYLAKRCDPIRFRLMRLYQKPTWQQVLLTVQMERLKLRYDACLQGYEKRQYQYLRNSQEPVAPASSPKNEPNPLSQQQEQGQEEELPQMVAP